LSFARRGGGFTSPTPGAGLPPSLHGLRWLLSSHWSLVVDGFVLSILGLWSFWSLSVLDLVRLVFLCCFVFVLCCFGANRRIFRLWLVGMANVSGSSVELFLLLDL
jgi:hypothetical protein